MVCEKCGENIYPNDNQQEHDCIQNLKKLLAESRAENQKLAQ